MDIITTHLHADFDCLASMAAAQKLYPEALIAFPSSQEKNVREYLAHTNLTLPIRKLKSLDLDDITRVIVVDASAKGRIGLFGDLTEKEGVSFHIYDHHPSTAIDLPIENLVIAKRGATVTIMVEILREKKIEISPDEATLFALGLYEDTGFLTYPSVTEEDFAAASWLLTKGANFTIVTHYIQRELNPAQIETLNSLLHTIDLRTVNGVTVGVASATAPRYVGDIASVAQKAMEIENLSLFFALIRVEDRIHLVARSHVDAVSAQDVATFFGGGGHLTAASATIRNLTLPQAVEKVWEKLESTIEPQPVASDLMTGHVITCEENETIESVESRMTRHDISGMPVVIGQNRVAGLITRQIVEKAIHHGLSDHQVREYMVTEFVTINPDTTAAKIEEIILGKRQKIAPVVDKNSGKLLGLVTRGMTLEKLFGDSLKSPSGAPLPGGRRRIPLSRDMTGIFRERLPEKIVSLFNIIRDVADKNEFTVYVVGGFVRDLLLRIPNIDIDIVVEGDGIDFANKLAARLDARMQAHQKFKTAAVILKNQFKIDIATARIEYYAHPAALPTVEMSAIRNDLSRRDFSINAMAIRLNGKRSNTLIDFFGGQTDIKDHAIRVLHNLSFVEDPTRVFRAVRFESRYNFTLGRQTLSLLKNAVKNRLFNRLSAGRLFAELKLILSERHPVKAIRRVKELGLLRFIHPAIKFDESRERLMERLDDLFAWARLGLPGEKVDVWVVRLMALTDTLNDADLAEMTRLFPTGKKAFTKTMITRKLLQSMISGQNRSWPQAPSKRYELFAPFSTEGLFYIAAKIDKKEVSEAITGYLSALKDITPLVSGDDLKSMGLLPSRVMGEALKKTLAAQLDGRFTTREEALKYAKTLVTNTHGVSEGAE